MSASLQVYTVNVERFKYNWNKKVLRLAGQRLLHIDKEVTCHLISLFVPGTFNGKTQWENPTSMGKPKS